MTGYRDILHIVRYDVRTRLSEYAQDLADLLATSHLADLFELQYDFNAKYRLKRDAVLTEPELLLIDDVNGCFFRGDSYRDDQEDTRGGRTR